MKNTGCICPNFAYTVPNIRNYLARQQLPPRTVFIVAHLVFYHELSRTGSQFMTTKMMIATLAFALASNAAEPGIRPVHAGRADSSIAPELNQGRRTWQRERHWPTSSFQMVQARKGC